MVITDKLLYNPPKYGFGLTYYDAPSIEVGVMRKVDAQGTSCVRFRNLPFP